MDLSYDHTTPRPDGYSLVLSGTDTYDWANRPGCQWPAPTLAGCRIRVEVDANGLTDLYVDAVPVSLTPAPACELTALVADHLPPILRHLWPVWAKEVAQ